MSKKPTKKTQPDPVSPAAELLASTGYSQEVANAATEAMAAEDTPVDQSEAEKNYGKEALDALLQNPDAANIIADSLEISVAEEIVRRLTKITTHAPRIRLSTVGSPVKLVWAIASDMRKANPDVPRAEIIKACEAAGIATATAKTQFQHWKKAGEAKPFSPAA